MTRIELKKQIENGLFEHDIFCKERILNSLTDIFIQLREEMLLEQREICQDTYCNFAGVGHYEQFVADLILNAPLPEII